MYPDAKVKCPHTGFSKSCRAIVQKWECPKFVKIDGTNPNTGEQVSKFGCIDSFLHMLLIENSQMQRQTGAAVESARNEAVKAAAAQAAATAQATEVFVQSARALVTVAARSAQRIESTQVPGNGHAPPQITHDPQ